MKRSFILVGLLFLFIAVFAIITGCNVDTDLATENLDNAAFSRENGPGSGNWKPNPTNANQCRALFEAETKLVADTVDMMRLHDYKIANCYDEKGNFIEDSEDPFCTEKIQVLEGVLRPAIFDAQTGFTVYQNSCAKAENAPALEVPSHLLEANVDPNKVPEIGDPNSSAYYCCLTCVQSLENPEYAFIDLDPDMTLMSIE